MSSTRLTAPRVEFDEPNASGDEIGGDIFDPDELVLLEAEPTPDEPAATPAPADPALRERIINLVTKFAPTNETAEDIVEQARLFEAYILGGTK